MPSAEEQAKRVRTLARSVVGPNPFYTRKLAAVGVQHWSELTLARLPEIPVTTKAELAADQSEHPPFGTVLGRPRERFSRVHQTSGTTGAPLRWLDTPESWQWWLRCWRLVYRRAGIGASDRILFPFGFGPFIGFWSAFEAAQSLGALAVPAGGLDSERRLDLIRELELTAVVCTPTYALRLAEVAREIGDDLAAGSVRTTLHAGEPGANLPHVRARIAAAFGARVIDHAGATEVGAWGYSCGEPGHLHVNEREFVAEILEPDRDHPPEPAADGGLRGELVLTNLGREASPALRYRTGDLVVGYRGGAGCGHDDLRLAGGVLGRVDGMLVLRGVNLYPSAVEDLVRSFAAIVEFQVRIDRTGPLPELVIEIEIAARAEGDAVAAELVGEVRRRWHLRSRVEVRPPGSLPRYELKARRFPPPEASSH